VVRRDGTRRGPPFDLIETVTWAVAARVSIFPARPFADPGQLGKVFAGRGHRGDAARQLPDNPAAFR
jgi:hypothetical protein